MQIGCYIGKLDNTINFICENGKKKNVTETFGNVAGNINSVSPMKTFPNNFTTLLTNGPLYAI